MMCAECGASDAAYTERPGGPWCLRHAMHPERAPVPASDPSWSTPNALQLMQLEWHPTRSREIL